jgi:hypothetical protein
MAARMPHHTEMTRCNNFGDEPPFPLRGLPYIKELPSNRAIPASGLAARIVTGRQFNRGMAWQID